MSHPTTSFPRTKKTWIDRLLDEGEEGHRQVIHHVMEVYSEPLIAFVSAAIRSPAVEPADLVHGFFERQLERSDYFRRWGQSGLPLRRWLKGGVLFHAQEALRSRPHVPFDAVPEPADAQPMAESALEAEFTRQLVRIALRRTEDECGAAGLKHHFTFFVAHHFEGAPYAALARRHGLEPDAVRPMGRSVARRFARAVRSILVRDGVPRERIDDEIEGLLGSLEP